MDFFHRSHIDSSLAKFFTHADNRFLDPRVSAAAKGGPAVYSNNDIDSGHLTRHLDLVWGSDAVARAADADTFCFTNACPQHKDLNQKEWLKPEDHVLGNAATHGLKVCVSTGPVFGRNDPLYRSIRIPREFWKVVATRRVDTGRLFATGHLLSQSDKIRGFEFVFGAFKTYQVPLALLAAGPFESAATALEVTGPEGLVL